MWRSRPLLRDLGFRCLNPAREDRRADAHASKNEAQGSIGGRQLAGLLKVVDATEPFHNLLGVVYRVDECQKAALSRQPTYSFP